MGEASVVMNELSGVRGLMRQVTVISQSKPLRTGVVGRTPRTAAAPQTVNTSIQSLRVRLRNGLLE
jgi:hypothetical protein